MVLGDISKGFEDGLTHVEKSSSMKQSVEYFLDSPNGMLKDNKRNYMILNHFGDTDFAKYAAWSMDPATYNYEKSVSENEKADQIRDRIVSWSKLVLEKGSNIYKHRDFAKNYKLIGPATRMRELANIIHPEIVALEKKRANRKIADYESISPITLVPDYLMHHIPGSDKGSFF
ncbi:MAG: hypothetical protein GOV02_03585 [Candidatus Aenigmarchaeota archaeon]|nr:hypothetical protein [Candidatus Aenigmarchaeota archaeon]